MSAIALLEIDTGFAQGETEKQRPTTSQPAPTASAEESQSRQIPESAPIPELEILKEETESISRGLAQERPISEAPQNVYIITDEDIRHSGAIDLPTVLRRIPGIDVMQVTGADFNVAVRGDQQLLQNKLLVLVDGRSIYEDIQGQVWWKSIPVTLPEIKRIEVLKGPASVLYGFNAFDGVINIITKSPDEMKGSTLQFGGGEFGTISAAAIQAGSFKKWGYRLSGGQDQTAQWQNSDALAYRNWKFNGQVEYKFDAVSSLVATGGFWNTNRFDGPVLSDQGNFIHAASTVTNGHATLLYQRPNFFIRTWWQGWNQDTTNNVNPTLTRFIAITDRFGNPTFVNKQDSYNIEGQHAIDMWARNRLTYGFNYRYNTGTNNSFSGNDIHENRLGFYVQDEWKPIEKVTVIAGVRYDLNTFIDPTISPRGAILYQPHGNHTFRVSASVGYRPPTMFETDAFVGSKVCVPAFPPSCLLSPITPRINLLGSDQLNPEQIVSYEAGYQGWYLKHRLQTRGALFFNHISNLIGRAQVSPPGAPAVFTFVNSPGVADIWGIEAGFEYLATSWLTVFANYTYQQINQNITPNEIRRGAPQDKVNAGLRAEWATGLSAEAVVHYVSSAAYPISSVFSQFSIPGSPVLNAPRPPSSTVGSYTLLNLRAGYTFWQQKAAAGYMREAEVAVSAFNALDDEHKEHPLGDVISRRVLGWLTIRF